MKRLRMGKKFNKQSLHDYHCTEIFRKPYLVVNEGIIWKAKNLEYIIGSQNGEIDVLLISKDKAHIIEYKCNNDISVKSVIQLDRAALFVEKNFKQTPLLYHVSFDPRKDQYLITSIDGIRCNYGKKE